MMLVEVDQIALRDLVRREGIEAVLKAAKEVAEAPAESEPKTYVVWMVRHLVRYERAVLQTVAANPTEAAKEARQCADRHRLWIPDHDAGEQETATDIDVHAQGDGWLGWWVD